MSLLVRYARERLPIGLLAPVAILIAIAAQAGALRHPLVVLADVALAGLLFAQCRILDDIADREHDAARHPCRVLVGAASSWPVGRAGIALALATIAMLHLRQGSVSASVSSALVGYGIGAALLVTWYAARGGRTVLSDHLLLAKYPAFVWIVAASRASVAAPASPALLSPLALWMLASYLAACVYEALHDGYSPFAARPLLVAGESLLLVLTLTILSIRGLP